MQTPLTKSSVATRQLATPIDLYFAEGDLVSVYSLAANAWEVVDALCIKAGIASMSGQTRENVPKSKDLKRNYINSPHRNFFKHADNDPEASVEPLSITHVEGLLFLAVEDYIRLHNRSPVQLQVYQAWYLAKYPEKLDPNVAADLTARLKAAFPYLSSASYPDQLKTGRHVVSEASRDQGVLNDPRTEPVLDGRSSAA